MRKYSIKVFICSGLVQELGVQQLASTSNHGAAAFGQHDAVSGEAGICL